MKTETWIPKPTETVIYNSIEYKVLVCNLAGKCKIKKLYLPNKGKILENIDVSDLTKK